jgi:hypothetical protein
VFVVVVAAGVFVAEARATLVADWEKRVYIKTNNNNKQF